MVDFSRISITTTQMLGDMLVTHSQIGRSFEMAEELFRQLKHHEVSLTKHVEKLKTLDAYDQYSYFNSKEVQDCLHNASQFLLHAQSEAAYLISQESALRVPFNLNFNRYVMSISERINTINTIDNNLIQTNYIPTTLIIAKIVLGCTLLFFYYQLCNSADVAIA